ncbi:hypothetical protein M5689_006685 [Euphorbia peplus]|nr:hypothetical protein M5689_006685 [Euphorbia peplus]
MFGGWSSEDANWLSHMSIYDMKKALSSSSTIDLTDEEEKGIRCIQTGPEMTVPKRCPVGVVIGEYKICVFAASLYLKYKGVHPIPPRSCFLSLNFGVFDTRTETWIGLPETLDWDKCKPVDNAFVNSYCVYLSSLIIETIVGIFSINIDNPNLEWVQMDASESITFQGI